MTYQILPATTVAIPSATASHCRHRSGQHCCNPCTDNKARKSCPVDGVEPWWLKHLFAYCDSVHETWCPIVHSYLWLFSHVTNSFSFLRFSTPSVTFRRSMIGCLLSAVMICNLRAGDANSWNCWWLLARFRWIRIKSPTQSKIYHFHLEIGWVSMTPTHRTL